jgi:alcohol dehydrogenase (cytochrome c)
MLAGVTIAALPALAAEVTPERLINADREPQNWLMNHRTYDAQRYSPLDKINKGNVRDLKLVLLVAPVPAQYLQGADEIVRGAYVLSTVANKGRQFGGPAGNHKWFASLGVYFRLLR